MMRVLILGANGMLGHQLARGLESAFEVIGTLRGSEIDPALRRLCPRLPLYTGVRAEDPSSIRRAIAESRADVVVNCIGAVKQADVDPASSTPPVMPCCRINWPN